MLEVHIQLERRREWTAADQRRLSAHERRWAKDLGSDFSGYDLSAIAEQEKPEIVIPLTEAEELAAYAVLIEALSQFEALFPDVKVRVWDGELVGEARSPSNVDVRKLGKSLCDLLEDQGADAEVLEMLEAHLGGLHMHGVIAGAPDEDDDEPPTVDPALERARADFEIWKKKKR